ncbi:MAG TPA: pitrilysin family protein [Leptospiraceae bacterium]|nr:pitrilysin family protein [Leptospiraceae bacterium]HMW03587.1 pitrilysin family protein [Leptospiraceae bacterium]HMX32328.1 pitrilysin family protein [Leptospiraceae bacterium]HMY29492.1 pitrilysin family protein [Leptospiraceae bacterium]HMZ63587.1 pitrilysin family protein [Leptospiraceae bacterium]
MKLILNFINFKLKFLFLLFLGISLLAAPGDFVKDIKIDELDFHIPKVSKEDLNPNLKFYSIYSDKFPITYLEIAFYAGEADTEGNGIEIPALLSEVLRFGGSKKYPEETMLSKLESLGAGLSVSSDYDKITINVSYLSRDENTILDILQDLIQNPVFSEQALTNGKKKMIEMIARRNERTDSLGFRKAKELFYRGLLAGKVSQATSIENIKMEDLKSFWQLAQSRKKRISVTGLFDSNKIKLSFNEILPAANSNKPINRENVSQEILSKSLKEYKYKNLIITKDVNQSMVLMIGSLPRHNDKDFYALQILDYIIGGGGFNSYMMQQIRVDKGLAYSSSSYPIFKKQHGILYAYTLTKNQSLLQVHDLMKTILSEETFAKIKEKEIEDAKRSINNQFVFLFVNNNRIVSNQVSFDEDEMPENYLENYQKNINSVTLADILRVGKKYFTFDQLKTVIVTNKDSADKLPLENVKVILPEDSVE